MNAKQTFVNDSIKFVKFCFALHVDNFFYKVISAVNLAIFLSCLAVFQI